MKEFNFEAHIKFMKLIGASKAEMNREYDRCPKCGSYGKDHELRRWSVTDGDIYCKKCGEYVRMWDAY